MLIGFMDDPSNWQSRGIKDERATLTPYRRQMAHSNQDHLGGLIYKETNCRGMSKVESKRTEKNKKKQANKQKNLKQNKNPRHLTESQIKPQR